MSVTTQKKERIDLRVAASEKDLFMYVAEATHKSLSAFILESAYNKAQEIVASKTQFSINEKQWKEFNAILEQPAREIPQLKKLFESPNIFNE